MKKIFAIVCFCCLHVLLHAQSDSIDYKWRKKMSYKIGEGEVWSTDGLENFYVSKNGLINKYDSVGALKFSQSIKSLGRMTQMIPVNTMKLVHFSEEQQTLCYFDNTLSAMSDCIELSDKGIVNAVLVSASNQPNKIWVLDNLNSKLVLLGLDNQRQPQEILNLRGVLDIENISQIVEKNSRLYLLDREKGAYIFDLYGSLLEFIPKKSIQQLDANEQTLFTLEGNSLYIRSLQTGESFSVKLPVEGVYELVYRNRCFFFRTDSAVHKFELQFSE